MLGIQSLYYKFVGLTQHLQSAVLLLVRIGFGFQFMLTGWGKLQNLERTTNYFAGLHIPMPHFNAIMAGSTECFGGFLLLIGLGSRLISLPLAVTMLVAYATEHRPSLVAIFSPTANENGTIDGLLERLRNAFDQAPFPFLCAALVILAFGPGKAAIDHLIAKYIRRESPVAAQIRESRGAAK